MSRARVLLAALLLAPLAVRAQTVSPSDFDPSLRARDQAVLRRVRGGFSILSGPSAVPEVSVFPLSRGTVTVEESWLSDPVTGDDVLRGRVSFAPSAACPVCRRIRLVQVARVEVAPGRDLDWSGGQQNRNLIRTPAAADRGVAAGWFVDHDAIRCAPGAPCSPYFRDSWPNPDESADGASGAAANAPASLVDYPFGWQNFERISLEACVRCADTGEFLGCAEWGASWPATGSRVLVRPSAAEEPSMTFREAQRLFDDFY